MITRPNQVDTGQAGSIARSQINLSAHLAKHTSRFALQLVNVSMPMSDTSRRDR